MLSVSGSLGAEFVNFVWQIWTHVTMASSSERERAHKSISMRRVTFSLFKVRIFTSIHI